jgi:hypothetical protein
VLNYLTDSIKSISKDSSKIIVELTPGFELQPLCFRRKY